MKKKRLEYPKAVKIDFKQVHLSSSQLCLHKLVLFTNVGLMGFQVRYLALFCLFSIKDSFEWFRMGSLYKNIKLRLEFLKAPFLVLRFSYYALMAFLMLSVILLSMLMILFSCLSVIRLWSVAATRVGFWTWIWYMRPCGSIFSTYYFGRCSSELGQLVPFPYTCGRSNRLVDCMISLPPFLDFIYLFYLFILYLLFPTTGY